MRNLIWLFTRPLALLLMLAIAQLAWAQSEKTVSTTTSIAEPSAVSPATTQPEFERLVTELTQGSLSKRGQAIKALAAVNDERVIQIIEALQQGNLAADKGDAPLVAIKQPNGNFVHAVTGALLSATDTEKL